MFVFYFTFNFVCRNNRVEFGLFARSPFLSEMQRPIHYLLALLLV